MLPFSHHIVIASYFELGSSAGVVELLPFGHARHFPLSFIIGNREIVSGELNFFNSVLHKNFDPENFISPDVCVLNLNKASHELVILNALDNCFGHSLLKLFHAVQYSQQFKNSKDVLIILPASLKHFIKPEPGLNFLYVQLSFSQLEKCYVLNREIDKAAEDYTAVFLAGTETYGTFDRELLEKGLNVYGSQPGTTKQRSIIFYYRKDYFRKWSGNRQAKRITALFLFLRNFFDQSVEFYVVGDRDSYSFPIWIKDERTTGFSPATDFKNNTLFASALICIGLTGSHMLFPSLLSECTVHLHPSYKYKNMAEDIIVKTGVNEMLSAYTHLYYFGNHNCSDLKPEKLGILLLLHYQGLVEKKYKIFERGAISQQDWFKEQYPFLSVSKVASCRQLFNRRENKKNRLRYYLDKVIK